MADCPNCAALREKLRVVSDELTRSEAALSLSRRRVKITEDAVTELLRHQEQLVRQEERQRVLAVLVEEEREAEAAARQMGADGRSPLEEARHEGAAEMCSELRQRLTLWQGEEAPAHG